MLIGSNRARDPVKRLISQLEMTKTHEWSSARKMALKWRRFGGLVAPVGGRSSGDSLVPLSTVRGGGLWARSGSWRGRRMAGRREATSGFGEPLFVEVLCVFCMLLFPGILMGSLQALPPHCKGEHIATGPLPLPSDPSGGMEGELALQVARKEPSPTLTKAASTFF